MFCRKCGKQFPDSNHFCPYCGWKVITGASVQAPRNASAQSPAQASVQAKSVLQQSPAQSPAQAAVRTAPNPQPVKKKRHGFLKFLLIFTLIVAFLFTALIQPAWLPMLIKSTKPLPDCHKKGSVTQGIISQSAVTQAGDSKENGYTLTIAPNTLPDGARVTMEVLSQKDAKKYRDGDYTLLGSPVSLQATDYEGDYFGKNVTLTFRIPLKYQKENVQTWFIAYFNPRTGETEYFSPDYVDFKKQEIVFTVPHFSDYVPVEVKREEAIEIYLKKYASEQAMGQQEASELKDLMEPELRKMMDQIGVPKEAIADTISAVTSGILSKCKEGKLNDTAGIANNLITATYKYSENGDDGAFLSSLTQTAAEEVAKYALEANGVSTNIHPYPAKVAAGLLSKSGSIVGSLETGDYKQVAQDILEIGVNLEPSTAIASAVVNLVIASGQQVKYNFQANEIEKLYQMYRYGTDDFNAGNFNDLWLHVDNDFFFSRERGAERLLRQDYIEAYCQARGWSYTTFQSLPKEYQDEITYSTRNQLESYFEKRVQAEKASEKTYKDERKFVRGLYGIMDSSAYSEFFGETDGYDPMGRLEKIYQIRAKIEALAAPSKTFTKINWSDFVFDWISEGANGVSEDVLYRNAILALKKKGILKDGIAVPDVSEITPEEISGTYQSVSVRTENVEVPLVEGIVNTICAALGVDSEGVIEKNESEQMYDIIIAPAGGKNVRMKMIPADNPSAYAIYEGSLKKGKVVFKLKEDHSYDSNAIQISNPKFTLEFTKSGRAVYLSGGMKVNNPLVKAEVIFRGRK